MRITLRRHLYGLVLALITAAAPVRAEDLKARLASGSPQALSAITFSPLQLSGGSHLTLVSPARWKPLIQRLSGSLAEIHQHYTEIFGPIPPLTTSIRLMDEEDFFKTTGAPRWTNALYYKEEIIIPLRSGNVDWDNLFRAVKHEYTHAVVHALSAGRCPGWLDEGLAQWAEGAENPALRPALIKRLRTSGPVPLKLLQGGFTKLDSAIVPAAYAQSLYITQILIRSYGFKHINMFLTALRRGQDKQTAFRRAFDVSEAGFERSMGRALAQWGQARR